MQGPRDYCDTGGGSVMGDRAAESPNHVAVNNRDMSLFGLHLSRKKEVHFPSTSVRSIPLGLEPAI